MTTPSKKNFSKRIKNGEITPVYKEIPYSPPHLVYESLISPNSFLLESVKGPEKIARYSFIGFDPYLIFKVKNSSVEITTKGKRSISSAAPLPRLKSLVTAYKQKPIKSLPPFQGGAAGLLSYDFVQYLEKLPRTTMDDLKIPDAHFFMIDKLIAFDHKKKKAWIIVCPGARETALGYGYTDADWGEKYEEANEEIEKIKTALRSQLSALSKDSNAGGGKQKIKLVYDMKKKDYEKIVKQAKEYIAAGDIFQANLSLRVSAEIGRTKPWELYKILRSINPSPFAAYIDFEDYHIVSSSPERLISIRNGIVETRPIAGTRPRGKNRKEDEKMRKELLLNEKERAEHIMLIDLERND
ncbi:MAG: anthranilate synthase component I family protein, partial [Nitrospirae bacterium]|nr:anthranilate synthase component I family protein [Nitrospirota bacterium]